MGRPRKNPDDAKLPKRVSRGRSAFEYKHKNGETKRLCPLNASYAEVWVAYEEYMKSIDNNTHGDTFEKLINQFFESADFNALSKNTRTDYAKYATRVKKPFGKMPLTLLNLYISESTWISEDQQVKCRPIGKKRFCRGFLGGVTSADWWTQTRAKVFASLAKNPAKGI
ncbi:hypothetical protein SODG_000001 [Sodalis praecaptivus]